jgi:subtilase family serine protease
LPVDVIPSVLANAKFGFVIRDNSIINRVSTPTKLSTYISNGIIPIYSCYIEDFHTVTKEFQYRICFETESYNAIIKQFMTADITPQAVYDEYFTLFEGYYNSNFHIENITIKFQCILKAVKEKDTVSLGEET